MSNQEYISNEHNGHFNDKSLVNDLETQFKANMHILQVDLESYKTLHELDYDSNPLKMLMSFFKDFARDQSTTQSEFRGSMPLLKTSSTINTLTSGLYDVYNGGSQMDFDDRQRMEKINQYVSQGGYGSGGVMSAGDMNAIAAQRRSDQKWQDGKSGGSLPTDFKEGSPGADIIDKDTTARAWSTALRNDEIAKQVTTADDGRETTTMDGAIKSAELHLDNVSESLGSLAMGGSDDFKTLYATAKSRYLYEVNLLNSGINRTGDHGYTKYYEERVQYLNDFKGKVDKALENGYSEIHDKSRPEDSATYNKLLDRAKTNMSESHDLIIEGVKQVAIKKIENGDAPNTVAQWLENEAPNEAALNYNAIVDGMADGTVETTKIGDSPSGYVEPVREWTIDQDAVKIEATGPPGM